MKQLFTLLIIGCVISASVLAVLFVVQIASKEEDVGEQDEYTDFSFTTDDSVGHSVAKVDEVITMPESPEEYTITPKQTTGLVTSVVRSDYSPEFQVVADTLFIDKYWVRECAGPQGLVGNSVIMTARPDASLGLDQFLPTQMAIEEWESVLLDDMVTTVYSNLSTQQVANTDYTFTSFDLDSRFTSFTVNGADYEIHYGWVLNFVIFSPSHNCLVATINDLYAPHSH